LLGSVPTLFILVTITFFMMRVAPGGPFSGNRRVPADVIKNIERAYHLDEPLWMQFGRYIWGILHFDFGPSMKYRDYSVSELISAGFPTSLEVGFWAMLIATIVGIILGITGALRRNTPIDYAAGAIAMVGLAVPIFVIGPIAQIVFGLNLGWLPIAGWDGTWTYKIMPIVTLSLPSIAYVSRLMRGSMIETIRTNYVRTARAKGIGERRTILKHALRGAILPVVAYLGPDRDRADLSDSRHRPLLRGRRHQSGLSAGDGRHALLWLDCHFRQSSDRYRPRPLGPEGEL
jgi:oligopeptide transport system permease protein